MEKFWKYNLMLAIGIFIIWVLAISNFQSHSGNSNWVTIELYIHIISFLQVLLSVVIALVYFKKQKTKTLLYLLLLLMFFLVEICISYGIAWFGIASK